MPVKQTSTYMAVQIVKRAPNGALLEWYDSDMRATLAEARADVARLYQEFPNSAYTVIEKRIIEVGPALGALD
jgi:outer membrane protein assembly factor BamD (BamD/ComL family)